MKRSNASSSASETRELRFEVSGLKESVEILVDHWGVPHIYAADSDDVFLAQGWNAARDRLWQIDLWRRRGLGELAAAFGEDYVEQDRAIRLFVYRGDMNKEWAAYGSHARSRTEAFVKGVNAYVAAALSGEVSMPREFEVAGYAPAFWRAEDIVRVRNHGVVFSGAARQLAHAKIACSMSGLPADLPSKVSPPWQPMIPEGLDLASIPPNVLDLYHLARKPIVLKDGNAGLTQAMHGARPQFESLSQGSNNWVVAASRTSTGRPIVANDPHRAFELPSLRYLVHLIAPDLDLVGAGQPALPGIEIGHNAHVAFGLTIFPITQEDLCVYDTNPDDPNQYLYKNAWESMRLVQEEVFVRGKPSARVELKFTRHGPVLMEDRARHRAYAVRAAWLDTGGTPYFGSMSYLQAKDRDSFASALKFWGGPGENHVCADTNGNIGWFAAGSTPIRANSDGLFPVPGDGRYEWRGYLDQNQLPSERDPAREYVATANQMNLPQSYPYEERRVSFSWHDSARFKRISEVLDSLNEVSLDDCRSLQNDCLTLPGLSLIHTLRTLPLQTSEVCELALWLTKWDGRATADSPQAALFEIWLTNHLTPALLSAISPALSNEFCPLVEQTAVAALMARPDARLGKDPAETRNHLMLQTLAAAAKEAEARLGSDRTQWKWGSLATILFEHPFSAIAGDDLKARMNVGPAPYSGDPSSVALAYYRSDDYRVYGGASVRLLLDVGNWDASLAVNTPGQSGDPLSPHYRDLFPLWLDGGYFPLTYSRSAVEEVTALRIRLTPR